MRRNKNEKYSVSLLAEWKAGIFKKTLPDLKNDKDLLVALTEVISEFRLKHGPFAEYDSILAVTILDWFLVNNWKWEKPDQAKFHRNRYFENLTHNWKQENSPHLKFHQDLCLEKCKEMLEEVKEKLPTGRRKRNRKKPQIMTQETFFTTFKDFLVMLFTGKSSKEIKDR